MVASKCIITKLENKTRKLWLFSTLFMLVFWPFLDLAIAVPLSGGSIPKEALTEFTARVIVGVIQTIFLWHCAYRNHATKLLSFYLVAFPLMLVFSIVVPPDDSCNAGTTTVSDSCIAYKITTALVALSAFFWWLILSLKMKNVNKAIQKRALKKTLSLAE